MNSVLEEIQTQAGNNPEQPDLNDSALNSASDG